MSNKGINKIASSYIIKNIFNYIQDKLFPDNLFLYSKKFQKKLNLKLIGLKEEYLKRINLDKYLFTQSDSIQENYLYIDYQKLLKQENLSENIFGNIVYDVLENKKIKEIDEENINKIDDYDKLINIDSPLFNIISKTKNFEIKFSINISQINIDKFNLKNYYAKVFDKLNNSKIKYSSISYYLSDIKKINYLREINIDFKKIKRLTLNLQEDKTKKNYKSFFTNVFSFRNIKNNLIYLKICLSDDYTINYNIFKNLEKFKLFIFKFILFWRTYNHIKHIKIIINK